MKHWRVNQMSKERLEEIRDQLEESNSYDDNSNGYWYNAIKWLIEQAERAKELEKIKQAHIEELGYIDERLLEAEAQNQRYKEALIEVKKSLHLVQIFEPWVSVAHEIIDRVLEGEE